MRQAPADAVARVDIGDRPPSDVWQAIATADGFQDELADAVRELCAGHAHHERVPALFDSGVTAIDGGYARFATGLDRARETEAHQRALELTAGIGQDGMTSLGHVPMDALTDGPLAVLDAADRTPTIAVRIHDAFRERSRDQRAATCQLLSMLAQTCTVWVAVKGLTARELATDHRGDLPAEFSERVTARHEEQAPVDERVATARADLDPDGRPTQVLRDLADEPAETLSYDALTSLYEVSRSRISQVLSQLEDLGLVERWGARTDKHVDLLPAGNEYLDVLQSETTRQQRLDAAFSETGQPSHRTCNPAGGSAPAGEAPTADGDDTAYRTRYLGRAAHAAAGASATSGGVTVANGPLPEAEGAAERHTRFVSYDDDRDEAVVAVRATSPLSYTVSVAAALASPRFLDQALPPDRLEDIETPPAILRDARCIGGLSDEAVEDGQTLRDRLIDWGQDIEDMTTKLHNDDVADRDQFCGEILRAAHGLAGTIAHLADVAGVNLVRELRVPNSLDHGQLADLAETVSVATAIQSRYGHFATYRQLFEARDDKRQTALSPTVDAADPLGEYIGSLVIRGPSADRLGQHIEGRLSRPAAVHDDAPEIAVRIPVTTVGREAFAEVATRITRRKHLSPTRDAVTLLRAFTGDVYATATALQWLGSEDEARDIRLDEVRVALASLDADRILPDAPPTVSKAVAALLATAEPLSQTALADAADVATRSLRRHLDALETLDVIRRTDDGWRLALPQQDGERGEHICPEPVATDTAVQDLAFDLALAFVDDADRLGGPDDPVGAALYWPPDIGALRRELPATAPYLRLASVLCDTPDPAAATVTFGASCEQAAIQGVTADG